MKREKKHEQRPRRKGPPAQPGGVIEVSDFGHNLEAALREFRRTSAVNLAEDRRRRVFMPKPTRNARRRRGKILDKRRIALGLEQ